MHAESSQLARHVEDQMELVAESTLLNKLLKLVVKC